MSPSSAKRIWPHAALLLVAALCLGAGPSKTSSPKAATPGKALPTPSASKMAQFNYTAGTFDRVAKQGKVRAGNLVWKCKGKACTISGPWPTPGLSACKALAQEVGKIRIYGHPGKSLSTSQLAQCNAGLPSAPKIAKKKTSKAHGAPQPVKQPPIKQPPSLFGGPRTAEKATPGAAARPEPPSPPQPTRSKGLAAPSKLKGKLPSVLLPGTKVTEAGDVRIRTKILTITGMGENEFILPEFTPVRIRTEMLTITGLGDENNEVPEFTPVRIRTEMLTITGLGNERNDP